MRAERALVALLALGLLLAAPSTEAAADDAGAAGETTDTPDAEGDPHAGANPHAGGHGGGMFDVPEDGTVEDSSIPEGTVEVHIADAQNAPMPRTEVTLGIIHNSVAKGESRKRVTAVTDDAGNVRFSALDTGSGVAYRAMVLKDGATFSAPPFQLGAAKGTRALLHVYPVTSDIESSLVVAQAILYAEVKDDRIQLQEAFKIYNFGRTAWVPKDLVVPLPPSFTAFAAQQGMTDVGVDAVSGKGVRLRGTFAPGQHIVEFNWQLPYSGEREVRFDVGMMPHIAAARMLAPASKGMTVSVAGFPAPQVTSDGGGQRMLVTELQRNREDGPMQSMSVTIGGLPTSGPGRWIATLLAAGGLGLGLVFGSKKTSSPDRKRERARLLHELAQLERAHSSGEVGPKTYERGRRELIDGIAGTLRDDARDVPATKKRRGRSARARG